MIALSSSAAAGPAIIGGPVTNPGNGHIYDLLAQSNGDDAETAPIQLGGYLATIDSQSEQGWVFDTFGASNGNTNVARRIGLNDIVSEGAFVWSSGEAADFTYWAVGEPNDFASDEDVTEIN